MSSWKTLGVTCSLSLRANGPNVRLDQSDEGVSAEVVKDGAPETILSQWLIGCDGGHSIVRKQANIGFPGETREEVRMIVADVEAAIKPVLLLAGGRSICVTSTTRPGQ